MQQRIVRPQHVPAAARAGMWVSVRVVGAVGARMELASAALHAAARSFLPAAHPRRCAPPKLRAPALCSGGTLSVPNPNSNPKTLKFGPLFRWHALDHPRGGSPHFGRPGSSPLCCGAPCSAHGRRVRGPPDVHVVVGLQCHVSKAGRRASGAGGEERREDVGGQRHAILRARRVRHTQLRSVGRTHGSVPSPGSQTRHHACGGDELAAATCHPEATPAGWRTSRSALHTSTARSGAPWRWHSTSSDVNTVSLGVPRPRCRANSAHRRSSWAGVQAAWLAAEKSDDSTKLFGTRRYVVPHISSYTCRGGRGWVGEGRGGGMMRSLSQGCREGVPGRGAGPAAPSPRCAAPCPAPCPANCPALHLALHCTLH